MDGQEVETVDALELDVEGGSRGRERQPEINGADKMTPQKGSRPGQGCAGRGHSRGQSRTHEVGGGPPAGGTSRAQRRVLWVRGESAVRRRTSSLDPWPEPLQQQLCHDAVSRANHWPPRCGPHSLLFDCAPVHVSEEFRSALEPQNPVTSI